MLPPPSPDRPRGSKPPAGFQGIDIARAEGRRGGRGGAARRYSPLGSPPLASLEGLARQVSSGASPVGAANTSHPGYEPLGNWRAATPGPRKGPAYLAFGILRGRGDNASYPNRPKSGGDTASPAAPRAGKAPKEYCTFPSPTRAAAGVRTPKAKAMGTQHKWRA